MEIQEPTLRALTVAYSWARAPRFPDVRGHATEVLRQAAESQDDWAWDSSATEPLVFVWNEDRRLHFHLSGSGIDIVSERPENPALVAASVVAPCAELLNVDRVDECMASGLWLLAAPSVDDAAAGIERAFGSDRLRQLLEPLGGRPSRLEFVARFEDQHGRAVISAKPATAEELVDDVEFFLSDIESSELPPAAIAVRIRRVRSVPEDVETALDRSSRLLESVRQVGDKLLPQLVTA